MLDLNFNVVPVAGFFTWFGLVLLDLTFAVFLNIGLKRTRQEVLPVPEVRVLHGDWSKRTTTQLLGESLIAHKSTIVLVDRLRMTPSNHPQPAYLQ